MSDLNRLLWDVGDLTIRSPTADEIAALGDVEWQPPSSPPAVTAELAVPPISDGSLTVDVREHGELGPVLVNADQHFTSKSEVN